MDGVGTFRTIGDMKVSMAATALKKLREQAGMSVREVAEKLGRPASTYASYEDKFKKPFLPIDLVNSLIPVFGEKGIARADVLKLSGVVIEKTEALVKDTQQETEQKILTRPTFDILALPKDLRILGTGACGEDGMFELNGEIHDYHHRPGALAGVRDAYGLWVKGVSMEPWRFNGEPVYVHPHQPVNILDFVVVQLKQEQDGSPIPAYIKRLVRRTARELRLFQYNPEEELTIPMSKVLSIHRIVPWGELFGR